MILVCLICVVTVSQQSTAIEHVDFPWLIGSGEMDHPYIIGNTTNLGFCRATCVLHSWQELPKHAFVKCDRHCF